MTGKFK